jgi:hypothetical protein
MRVPANIGTHAALPARQPVAAQQQPHLLPVQLLLCNNVHAFGMTLMPGVTVPALPAPVVAAV